MCRQGIDFQNHGSELGTTVFCDESAISDIAVWYKAICVQYHEFM